MAGRNPKHNNVCDATLKGARSQNEDHHVKVMNLDGSNPNYAKVNFFAVYDGHGGKQVSAFLRNNLTKYFMNKKVNYPLTKRYVNAVFDNVQAVVAKEPYSQHVGSTALIVIQFKYRGGDYLNVINLGDCRAILCRGNMGIPLNKEHKPNWPEEYQRLSNIGAKIVFDGFDHRVNSLSLSRSFGDLDAKPAISHKPDLYRYKLDKSDKFLVIACDGLLEGLKTVDSVANFILTFAYDKTLTKRINPEKNYAQMLAQRSIDQGSTDNVSCFVIFFE